MNIHARERFGKWYSHIWSSECKGFLIPKYSISTRTSKLCFTFRKSTGGYLLCQVWVTSVHYLVAKLEMAAVSLPWNSQAYIQWFDRKPCTSLPRLGYDIFEMLLECVLIFMSSVNKYLCGVEECVHIHLSVLWSACIPAWLLSDFRAFSFH